MPCSGLPPPPVGPLPGPAVRVSPPRENTPPFHEVSATDGSITFAGLPPVPHRAAATLAGYRPADPLLVPLHEGRTDTVTLVLRRTGSIEVLLHDDRGRPLAGPMAGVEAA